MINSFFLFQTFNAICESKKKSTIKNVTILFVSHELQISTQISNNRDLETINRRFLFLDRYSQFNMRDREKINKHSFVDFVKNVYYIYNITKTNIRICNDFRNDHFIEKIAFLICCIKNCIKIDEEQINSMIYDFVAIVFIFSNVRIKTSRNF